MPIKPSDRLYAFNVAGHQFSLYLHPSRDLVSRTLEATGSWEPFETQLFSRLIQPGDVVLDAGANLGYYTVIASQRVGEQGRVYAFEPDAENVRLLKKNVSINGLTNVVIVDKALSATAGEFAWYRNEHNFGDHRLYQDQGLNLASTKVDTVNGDAFFVEQAITMPSTRFNRAPIQFYKLDTQGSEWHILKGLEQTLARAGEFAMILECWPHGLRRSGASSQALITRLMSFGLSCYWIDHLQQRLEPWCWQQLRDWVDSVDKDVDNQGFINLLLADSRRVLPQWLALER